MQRLAHDALDQTRVEEVNIAPTPADKRALKNTRWALQKSNWKLSDREVETLQDLEESNQTIYRGYLLKESLINVLDGRQINIARRKLRRWSPL